MPIVLLFSLTSHEIDCHLRRPGCIPRKPFDKRVSHLSNGLAKDCGTDSDIFQLDFIFDKPPRAGAPISFHFIGDLKEEIGKGSKIVIGAKFNGFPFPAITQDVCKLAVDLNTGYTCPIQPQKFDLKLSYPIPFFAPKGSYEVQVTGQSGTKKQIFHSKFNLKL